MNKLPPAVRDFIRELEPGNIMVACSGGPDSVALAHELHHAGYPIALAHVNYGLREAESDQDQDFVERLAQAWGIPCFTLKVSPNRWEQGKSTQVQAREIRYQFFEDLLKGHDFRYVALAHHADDVAETLLLSLMRSKEASLWYGIPHQRGAYIRPLIQVSRADILAYLHQNDLSYRQDRSNETTKYLRNRIRLEVLPALTGIHPDPSAQLLSRYAWYQQQEGFIRRVLAPHLPSPGSYSLDWQSFESKWGKAHLPQLIAETAKNWELSGTWQQAAIQLIDSQPGQYVDTPNGRLWRTRTGLELQAESGSGSREIRIDPSSLPYEEVEWGKWKVQFEHIADEQPIWGIPNVFYLDAGTITPPLTLRSWQQGDRMTPFGMKGSKLLSDIFVDEKYAPIQKEQALVIADAHGPVILSDFRIADRARITERTANILRISLTQPS